MISFDIDLPHRLQTTNSIDKTIYLADTNWSDYEYLLCNNNNYKISYFEGIISIVSPSRNHERISRTIFILVATYCEIYNIEYYSFGSADLKNPPYVGKQPDESYCFNIEADLPDLAIEVIFSSGGIGDLNKYFNLGIKEVWLWQNDRVTIYVLEDAGYVIKNRSLNLDRLTAEVLTKYANAGLNDSQLSIKKRFTAEINQNQ